jgi:hypothetical protein
MSEINLRSGKTRIVIREAIINGYVPLGEALRRWFLGGEYGGVRIDFSDIQKYKKSDTLVILGSGPSFTRVDAEVSQFLRGCDTFGINFSFLNPHIIPTYQIISYEPDGTAQAVLSREVRRRSQTLASVVFMVSDKMLWRFGHPRIMREFYPDHPLWCRFSLSPNLALINSALEFTDEQFDRTLTYRGTLTVALEIVRGFGYKKIVLAGVDPFSGAHFFDDYQDMQDYVAYQKARHPKMTVYENMIPKRGKELTIDMYLHALREYMQRKYGTQLCTLFSDDQLAGILPPSDLVQ